MRRFTGSAACCLLQVAKDTTAEHIQVGLIASAGEEGTARPQTSLPSGVLRGPQ